MDNDLAQTLVNTQASFCTEAVVVPFSFNLLIMDFQKFAQIPIIAMRQILSSVFLEERHSGCGCCSQSCLSLFG